MDKLNIIDFNNRNKNIQINKQSLKKTIKINYLVSCSLSLI